MHTSTPTARGLGLRHVAIAGLVALLAGPRGADALGLNGPSLRTAFAAPMNQGSFSLRKGSCLPGATCSRRPSSLGRVSMQEESPAEEKINDWARELAIIGTGAGVGVTAGLGVTFLKLGIGAIRENLYNGAPAEFMHRTVGGFATTGFNPEIAFFPLLGGFVTTILLLVNGASFGGGLGVQLDKVNDNEPLNVKQAVTKQVAAMTALGTGCSVGPEGPAVEIGVSIARAWNNQLGLPFELRKLMTSCGVTAGVAAGFDAPLTAILFALEIVQPNLPGPNDDGELQGILPRSTAGAVLAASAMSTIISRAFLGDIEKFHVDAVRVLDPTTSLPTYVALGVLAAGVATTFVAFQGFFGKFYAGEISGAEFMDKVPVNIRPWIGAGLTGLLATHFPQVLFFGYETLNGLVTESATYKDSVLDLWGLCVLKMALTASCLGSGIQGGILAPSLFFGATLGAGFQELLSMVGVPTDSEATFAVVGAASVLAALFRAPVTATLLLFELTQDYKIELPLLTAVGVACMTMDILGPNKDKPPSWAFYWRPPVKAAKAVKAKKD